MNPLSTEVLKITNNSVPIQFSVEPPTSQASSPKAYMKTKDV